jgi:phosphoribosylglycinamide formyltransferase 1
MTQALARIAVLVSGQGRNLQALLDAAAAGRLPAQIVCVVSNRGEAPALDRARRAGVPTVVVTAADHPERDAFDAALAAALDRCRPDFLAMAGFMRVLGPGFIRHFAGRMLNVHPSLLPRYRGLHTHRRVLEAGDAEHGASVHFVTEELDGGPVVIQGRFSVQPQDDEQSLAQRVMNDIELKIYPQALAWLAHGELQWNGGNVQFRGRPLVEPLNLEDLEPEFR